MDIRRVDEFEHPESSFPEKQPKFVEPSPSEFVREFKANFAQLTDIIDVDP
jgi:hypothetical protein